MSADGRIMSVAVEAIPSETKVPSKWTSHVFSADISETMYSFRVLKMSGSLFIYIGVSENQAFDELATAFPTSDAVGTTIIGSPSGCDSQDIAQLLTQRFRKQVFVSYNAPSDGSVRQLILKRIVEEINANAEAF